MMVYFVSQCERSALPKTRRILDTFANRVGHLTWQTIITEAGLQSVHKLLRETASKNSAISCHWIRSRARVQILWTVGRQNVFNHEGKVSVNFTTTQDVYIEGMSMNNQNIFANTKQQKLSEHLFAVGFLAKKIVQSLYPEHPNLSKAAFYAGLFHDLGKADVPFQEWLSKEVKKNSEIQDEEGGVHITETRGNFTWEKYPRHNETSYFLLEALSLMEPLKLKTLRGNIEHAVFWHHEKPLRKEEFKDFGTLYYTLKQGLTPSGIKGLLQNATGVLQEAVALMNEYEPEQNYSIFEEIESLDEDDLSSSKKSTSLPLYKSYEPREFESDSFEEAIKSCSHHAYSAIILSCLVSADRKISSLSKEQLSSLIKEKKLEDLVDELLGEKHSLSPSIEEMRLGFEKRYPESPRNQEQAKAAKELSDCSGVGVLNGPAGCGKTKIALEAAALQGASKIIWVCPRVQVCQGIYQELKEYLPQSKIEIHTGEFKRIFQNGKERDTEEHEKFFGDVVVTTIDQILNSITTHRHVTSVLDYLSAFVVFDEYHEYIHMAGFNLLFAELLQIKKLRGQKSLDTLLVSATPHYYFLEHFLKIDEDDIISVSSFNQSSYQISFKTYDEEDESENNPFYCPQRPNSFVISNTALTAQRSYLENQNKENALVFHGKFLPEDKADIFQKICESFGRKGSHQFDILRSGPIVQASLNVSCDAMTTELTHAENWLQRLGRLDRFGENEEVNVYTTAIPKTFEEGKNNGKCARFLSSMHTLQSARAWYEFLKDKSEKVSKPFKINSLYELYKEFYQSSGAQKSLKDDLQAALKKGALHLNQKIQDPVCLPKKQNKKEKQLKKSSIRGDNLYVQMAICSWKDGVASYDEGYACDGKERLYTLSTKDIESDDISNDERNLLSYMFKKHHKIESAKAQKAIKQVGKSFLLKKQALLPENPIFVSYTSSDLDLCGDSRNEYAIYYVKSEGKAVGAMPYNKIPNKQKEL